jgi:hypothetical protein
MMPDARTPGKDYANYGGGAPDGADDLPPSRGGLNGLLGLGLGCLMCCACVGGCLFIAWIVFVIVTLSGVPTVRAAAFSRRLFPALPLSPSRISRANPRTTLLTLACAGHADTPPLPEGCRDSGLAYFPGSIYDFVFDYLIYTMVLPVIVGCLLAVLGAAQGLGKLVSFFNLAAALYFPVWGIQMWTHLSDDCKLPRPAAHGHRRRQRKRDSRVCGMPRSMPRGPKGRCWTRRLVTTHELAVGSSSLVHYRWTHASGLPRGSWVRRAPALTAVMQVTRPSVKTQLAPASTRTCTWCFKWRSSSQSSAALARLETSAGLLSLCQGPATVLSLLPKPPSQ